MIVLHCKVSNLIYEDSYLEHLRCIINDCIAFKEMDPLSIRYKLTVYFFNMIEIVGLQTYRCEVDKKKVLRGVEPRLKEFRITCCDQKPSY